MFVDPNLVPHGGLAPVVALAERAGLPELLAKRVRPRGGCGVNTPLKVDRLVAGMAASADYCLTCTAQHGFPDRL